MTTAANLSQSKFRGRSDAGAVDGTPTWIAAVSTNWSQFPNTAFRVRFLIQNTTTGNPTAGMTVKLQANNNGGAFQDVTTTSTIVKSVDAGSSADETSIATALLAGTGTYVAGRYDETGGVSTGVSVAASGNTEYEFGIQINAADVANGDAIGLKVVTVSGSTITATASPAITAIGTALATESKTVPAFTQTVTGTAAQPPIVTGVYLRISGALVEPSRPLILPKLLRIADVNAVVSQADPAFTQTATGGGIPGRPASTIKIAGKPTTPPQLFILPGLLPAGTTAVNAVVSQTDPDFSQTATGGGLPGRPASTIKFAGKPGTPPRLFVQPSIFPVPAGAGRPASTINVVGKPSPPPRLFVLPALIPPPAASVNAVVSQTVPAFSQTVTGTASPTIYNRDPRYLNIGDIRNKTTLYVKQVNRIVSTATASQAIPAISQTATGKITVKETASQAIPAFGKTATATIVTAGATASQTIPSFGKSEAAKVLVKATSSQIILPFGETAGAETIHVGAEANQTVPAFSQTVRATVLDLASASQTTPDFAQSALASTITRGAFADQFVPLFGSTGTGAVTITVIASQVIPDFITTFATPAWITSVIQNESWIESSQQSELWIESTQQSETWS